MKIIVCVKQVPDTTEIKIDPVTNTLIRAGVPSIVNISGSSNGYGNLRGDKAAVHQRENAGIQSRNFRAYRTERLRRALT